jgi:hypothetical protein
MGSARHRCPLAVKAAHAVLLDVLAAPASGICSVIGDHPWFARRRSLRLGSTVAQCDRAELPTTCLLAR